MKYQKYPVYKDSGVEWIGEIPERWKLTKFKRVAKTEKGKLNSTLVYGPLLENYIPYLSMEYLRSGVDPIQWVPKDDTSVIANKGDILLLWDGSNAGEFLNAKYGAVSSTIALVKLKNINRGFFFYWCKIIESQIQELTVGMGIPHVDGNILKDFITILPSIDEQYILSNFLDSQTSKIDSLISNLQKMIELLKEKRQALITHAVTKGLDPNVPTKDSGVEWIGEIPEHWKLVRLKRLVNLATKSTKNNGTKVALENIESWTGKYVRTLSEYDSEGIAFEKGDILFGKLRPYLAKVYLTDFDGEAVGDFYVLRISSNVDDMFLFQLLATREFISIVDSSTYGTKMPRVNWDFMGNLKVPIPALREQSNIGSFIVKIVNKTDILVSNLKKMIELLKEYRSTLISAAVTGKIDVRNLKNNDFPESE